jgi:hypothetical protein
MNSFFTKDPESAKETHNLTVFFELLGFPCVKVARRTLMMCSPGGVEGDHLVALDPVQDVDGGSRGEVIGKIVILVIKKEKNDVILKNIKSFNEI